MPGLLSNVFGDDSGGADQTTQQMQEYGASGAGIDLSPSVTISHEASGSYQNLDGSTTEWSSEGEVTLTIDVSAALDVTGVLDQTDTTEA